MPSFTGIWLGTLATGGKGLRLQLHLDLSTTPATCALDSLDQGAMAIPCEPAADPTNLQLGVPAVKGTLTGTLSDDGKTITGTWSQGSAEIPLVLTRQATSLPPVKIAMDPEMPAVDVAKIQSVLDGDLANIVPKLTADSGLGITIGVVEHGTRAVFSYGAVKPDSVFEIGSVTKTFTGLVLAQLVEQKKVKLDDPVRALLPKGTVAAPASGPEITLLDLSAQRSGLPRMPDNFAPKDDANPYVDYDAKALYAYVAAHGVARPDGAEFGYSNLGVGLLGQALVVRTGKSYDALVREEITAPLGMADTGVALSPALTKRFVAGHGAGNAPQHAWDFGALAGAGALRSTANDMLTYLDAQLHPEHVTGKSAASKTLPAAIAASHEVRGEAGGNMHIALNWFKLDGSGAYWHNGATGGYSSFALFDPAHDFAVIVLFNRSVDDGMFADELGQHIAQRLLGAAAPSLSL
jgi:CubicO group peptidase (beta-lactamase class C family)